MLYIGALLPRLVLILFYFFWNTTTPSLSAIRTKTWVIYCFQLSSEASKIIIRDFSRLQQGCVNVWLFWSTIADETLQSTVITDVSTTNRYLIVFQIFLTTFPAFYFIHWCSPIYRRRYCRGYKKTHPFFRFVSLRSEGGCLSSVYYCTL